MLSPTEYQAIKNLSMQERRPPVQSKAKHDVRVVHYAPPQKKQTFWEFMREQLAKEEEK